MQSAPNPMDMLGKEYWSLANAITAFAVAQSLAFAYALAGQAGDNIRSKRELVAFGIGVAAFVFSAAVWFCNHAQIALLDDGARAKAGCLLTITMIGRIAAILGYNTFAMALLYCTGRKPAPGS